MNSLLIFRLTCFSNTFTAKLSALLPVDVFFEASIANCEDTDLDCSIWSSLICVHTVCMQHRITVKPLKKKTKNWFSRQIIA